MTRRSRFTRMRSKVSVRRFSSAVLPISPTVHEDGEPTDKDAASRSPRAVSPVLKLRGPEPTFLQAFGSLGVPLLLVICVSIVWTTWLLVLNIAPNATANYLMDTAKFDDGSYWLIIDPDPVFLGATCLGLGAVLLGYVYALAAMAVLRTRRFGAKATQNFASRITRKVLGERVVTTWSTFTGFQGLYRRLWNLWLKTIDLVLQIVTLSEVLEEGFPTTLCYAYAALLAANCFSCVFAILLHKKLTAFTEVLIDTVFDMLIAVAAPITLLLYSYHNFHFDREAFRAVLALSPAGSFERHARMSADPSQVTLFLINLNALRIQSALGFLVRVGMNLAFAYRLKRIIEVTSQHDGDLRHVRVFSSRSLAAQKVVPRWAALLFLGVGCVLLVYTHQCIRTSRASRARYPQCAAYAHRVVGDHALCPCIALIDVDKAPKTFAEWTNPLDATETLVQPAKSGDLQVLELTNRKLLELPTELRKCTGLRHISLMYTGIQVIPVWAKDFAQLEFLNVEGKSGDVNLVSVPADVFSQTTSLTYLHLGARPSLERLPSLARATNLKSVSVVLLPALREFPSLATLRHLKRLELSAHPGPGGGRQAAALRRAQPRGVVQRIARVLRRLLGNLLRRRLLRCRSLRRRRHAERRAALPEHGGDAVRRHRRALRAADRAVSGRVRRRAVPPVRVFRRRHRRRDGDLRQRLHAGGRVRGVARVDRDPPAADPAPRGRPVRPGGGGVARVRAREAGNYCSHRIS